MNRRLQQFLSAENITQSQFADTLGVARASVSHIIAGRNKPGFDFIESIARKYPELNLDWLLCGKGKMYKSTDEDTAASTPAAAPVAPQRPVSAPQEDPRPNIQFSEGKRKVTRVMLFFDDGTFQEIKGGDQLY